MRRTPGLIAAAAGVLVMLCVSAGAFAQDTAPTRIASLAPGTIHGLVRDDSGAPIAGASCVLSLRGHISSART